MAEPMIKLPDDRLVIAVDFGTTYSGVAYAFNVPGKKADVVPILKWPGLEGHRQPKVPTLILYDNNYSTKFKWGGQVTWRDSAVRGVKLLLDPGQKRPAYLPASSYETGLRDLSAVAKDPVDAAADFIGAIYKHALSVIESAGIRDYFHFCQKDFVLSVPAVWSDKAKDLTLKAAKKAGIDPVTLIKEPEAAALYTLTTHDHAIKPGEAFVVCDAGGGTVDLITYQIKKIEPYLQLAELVPGDGGMAGSIGLNKRFEEAVLRVVGEDQFYHLKNTVGWAKALNDFDKNIKTAFNGDIDEVYYVNFPKADLQDNLVEGLSGNCWEMTGDVLQGIFEPIVKDVLRLVNDQVRRTFAQRGRDVKAIFLVGGFGSSSYLKARLERVYASQGIQVIQPHDAWGAIVKDVPLLHGAVLSRVANQAAVVSTKAVRHYGVSAWSIHDPVADQGRVTEWRADEGRYRCEKLSWFIYMGADLNRDRTIKLPFYRTLVKKYTQNQLIFADALYFSEAAVAPRYPGHEVTVCCRVRSDLRGLGKQDMVRRLGVDGRVYYDVKYNLVLCTAHANLKFSLEFQGKEMGSVEATYV